MMTVKMGNVWDRTVQILQGRAGIILPIALLALFLPAAIGSGLQAYGPACAVGGLAAASGLIALVKIVATLWGQLAIMAVASDPATTRAAATRAANARFGPALLVAAVEIVVVIVLFLPAGIAFGLAGANFAGSSGCGTATQHLAMGPGVGFASLYVTVLSILLVIAGIRVALAQPVILHEAVGLRALLRSWRLTHGIGWRLFGVALLAIIVLGVASAAATSVTGILAALIVGRGGTAVFLASMVGQMIATLFTVLAAIFIVQLYFARREPLAS